MSNDDDALLLRGAGVGTAVAVAKITGIAVADILGSDRRHRTVLARTLTVLAMRARGYSWPRIGIALGHCHTSTMRLGKGADFEEIRREFGEIDVAALVIEVADVVPASAHLARQVALADEKAWGEFRRREYPFSWAAQAATPPHGASWATP